MQPPTPQLDLITRQARARSRRQGAREFARAQTEPFGCRNIGSSPFKCASFTQRLSLFRSKTAEWTCAHRAAAVDVPHKTSRTLAAAVQGPETFPAFCGAAVCGSSAEFLSPVLHRILLRPCRETRITALNLRRGTNLTF